MVAFLVSAGGNNCGNGAGDAPYPTTGFDSVRHSRRLIFQLSEVSVPRRLFKGVLDRIGRLSPAPI